MTERNHTISIPFRYKFTIPALVAAALAVMVMSIFSGSSGPSITSAVEAALPDQPTDLNTVAGDTEVQLTWDDPEDDSITKYQLWQLRETGKLETSNSHRSSVFGYSIAVDGDTAVVGAKGYESGRGAAYVYTRDPDSGAWSLKSMLTASDGEALVDFGYSVAVDGDTVVVGANEDRNNVGGMEVRTGSAYVFVRPAAGWSATSTQTAKLTASDGEADDRFGYSVAVSGDTVVVGAHRHDARDAQDAPISDSGAAYVFTRSGTSWNATSTQTAKLTLRNPVVNGEFGHSVAVLGDTIVIGAIGTVAGSQSDAGSAFVFTKPNSGWADTDTGSAIRLRASDREGDAFFGWSIAMDGDTIVIGARRAKNSVNNAEASTGSAYVFTRPSDGWATSTESAKLTASDRGQGDRFGGSVAVDGDIVVVGAPDVDIGNKDYVGAAYVFIRPADGWANANETVKLIASDGGGGDGFGQAIAVDGDSLLVGAPEDDSPFNSGSVYVFGNLEEWTDIPGSGSGTRSHDVTGLPNDVDRHFRIRAVSADGAGPASQTVSATPTYAAPGKPAGLSAVAGDTEVTLSWNDPGDSTLTGYQLRALFEHGKITAADRSSDDRFGVSVAVDGDTAVVGAYQHDHDGIPDAGAAYVFIRDPDSGAWSQQAKLTASSATTTAHFGISVAVSEDTIVVGARGSDSDAGASYVFIKPAGGWTTNTETAKLTASDAEAGDEFGSSVAVYDNTVVIGAPEYQTTGSAYVFTRSGTSWNATSTETAKLTVAGASEDGRFGSFVAMDGKTVVIGAPGAKNSVNNSEVSTGSAYVFIKPSDGWASSTPAVKLTAPDGADGDEFGRSVAVDGRTIVVGASKDQDPGGEDVTGSAYVFIKPSEGWASTTPSVQLTASDGAVGDEFGRSVAVDGQTIVAGAHAGDGGGSIYVFTRPSYGWATSTETAKLTASDGREGDQFGIALALDGETAVVAAPRSDATRGVLDTGSAYFFSAPGWADVEGSSSQTTSVDVSGLTNYIEHFFLIRAVDAGGNGPSSVHVSATPRPLTPLQPTGISAQKGDTQVQLSWNDRGTVKYPVDYYQTLRLGERSKSDGDDNQQIGYAVDVDGDVTVVGAPQDPHNGEPKGAAYVVTLDAATGLWSQRVKINASDREPFDQFGYSVAIDDDTVVVGAVSNDPNSTDTGSAYVFTKPSDGWAANTETAKLTASDNLTNDRFGHDVGVVDGDYVVIGAPFDSSGQGAVYVFTKPEAGWNSTSTAVRLTVPGSGYFGWSVAADANRIIVGAPETDSGSGAAYVFTRPEGGWNSTSTVARLTAFDRQAGDWFGASVALHGSIAAIGSQSDDGFGSAYVFSEPTGGWTTTNAATPKLNASDGASGDGFGLSISVEGPKVVVGAPFDNTKTGAAYVFIRPPDGWDDVNEETAKLTASDSGSDNQFALSVALSGDTVAVGAPFSSSDDGAAYWFDSLEWTAIPGSGPETTSHILTGLTNDVEHMFRVRGVNGFGEGTPSDLVSATPEQAESAPAQPSGLSAQQTGEGTVELTWDVSSSPLTVVGYQVTPDDGLTWGDISGSDYSTASSTVSNLTAGPYTFAVRAFNSADDAGQWSDSQDVTVVGRASAPSGFTARQTGAGVVQLTWVANPDSEAVTGYEFTQDGSSNWNDTSPESASGTFTYPVSNLVTGGTYTFAVRAVNAAGAGYATDFASLKIVVNVAPYFDSDVTPVELAVDENSPEYSIVGSVTATDAEGDDLTYSLSASEEDFFVIAASTGQITVGSAAVLDFESASTSYSVIVSVHDGKDADGNTETDPTIDDSVNVTINVNDANDAPVAVDDSASINEGGSVTINVQDNDSDAENDNLTTSIVTGPSNGTAIVIGTGIDAGKITYTHDGSESTSDSFTYMVSDGLLSSNVATTSISISAVNDAPVAVDDSASINEGGSVTINVQDNDSDAENDNLTTSIVTGPSNGTAIVIGTGIDAGKITYTHDGSESTSDSFTYMVSDGLLSSNVATTSISISAVNDAPVAVDDSASINEGGSVTINVQDNDSDAENDNLTTSIVTGPSNGTAIVIGTGIDAGKITYTHDGSESTSDSFTYMVSDGLLSSNVATTSISISAVNDAPVAVDDSASINEGGSVTINVQDNDSDAENDNLTTSIVTGPSNGTAIVIGTGIDAGKITYTHDGSESTSDSFTYMVSDGLLSSNVATTSISISAVNDAPVAVDDSASINEGGSVTINVQDNDSDAENDNLTTSIVTGPSNGTAIVIGTGIDAGKITYTHDGSESTSDSFTYMVSDGLLSSNVATTSISISAVNDAPVAVDDSASINEGGSVTINVQDNDSDAENDNLTTSIVTGPSNGTAIVIGTGIDAGKITYTHDGSESTSDSFTYMVSDGLLSSNVATTSISISAVNDAPVAVDDSASINEGGSVTINVQDNDSDAENDNLTTSIVTGPSNGTAIVIGTGIDAGKITYTHDGSESTSDSFTYMVSDGLLSSNVATTSISISAVNDAPVAVDDSASINEGGSVTINVQDNDSDAENDNLTTSIVTGPSNGTAIVIGTGIDAGKITYTHDGSESTSDSFTYMVSDGLLSSNVATTSISISAVNDAPVAVDDSASINEGGSVTINVQDNDSDAENDNLTTSIVTGPSNGTAIVIGTGIDAGKITYTHDGSESTSDSFTYMVSDGLLSSNVATTSISISAVNDAPVAVDDSASINEGGSVTINVQDNDSDAENDNLTTSIVTGPSNGTAIVIGTGIDAGKITYTHDGSESTSDSFTYMVSDGLLSSNVATTSISISAVNDAPVAVDDSASINEGGSVTINVQDNDSDAENDNLTTSIVTGPSNGTAIVIGTGIDAGKITYTHDGSESTSDSFTYMVSDGLLSSNVATTSISISAVNDAPVAVDDSASINEGGSVTINVQDNDSDAENDNLTTSIVTGPSNGTAIVIGTGIDAGKITYTHDGSESTSDSFTYMVSDGLLSSNVATTSISISAVNDAPVAVDDSASINEGGSVTINVQDNDSDAENDNLTTSIVTGPSNGTAIVIGTGIDAGKITYTHDGSESTSDSFTYMVSDGLLSSNVATTSISISAVNDAPVAVDDSASINEGGSVTINVQDNDSDAENDNLTTSIVTGPSNGTAIVIGTGIDAGKITYTHDGSESTSDSFTYMVSDGLLSSNVATTSISISAVNDAPVAVDDSASINEGGSVTINVQDNDSDAENDNLTTSIVTGPSNGTAIVIGTGIDAGKITYTHDGSESTSDSFTYMVSDGLLSSNVATTSISISAVNDAPVAVDDSASINEGGSVTINVQDNDSDAENDNLTTSIVTGPSNGTAIVIGTGIDAGKITYTHDGSESTSDSFTYMVSDGLLSSNVATTSISISAVNDAPVAVDDSASINEGGSVTINVQDNDSDAENDNLTTSIVTGPSNGTAIVIGTGIDAGKITYTHDGSESTSDSFTYMVSDGLLSSNVATTSISISAVNDAPVAVDDSASINEGGSVTINVQDNDSDAENDNLTTSIVTGPSNGTAIVIGTGIDAGKITYTHDGSESTSDSFTYMVSDGLLSSNVATTSISISAVNDAPVAVDDSASINEGGSVTINVQDNDSDAENDNLTTSIVTGPSNGTAIVIGTGIDAGKITYTHDGSESTSDSFTYMVSDGLLSSNVATTSISISAVNDAPVAVDDSASINEGGSVTINVQDNDSDAENDNLTTSIVTGPSNGTAIVIGTGIDAGKITYTHDGSESTSDSFTYMVSDGLLSSNVATTSISISAVNDAPVAVDDSASINEGGSVTINVQDNDSDAENDNLTTSIVTGPSNGTAIVIGTGIDAGKITYTHDGSESTSDSFTYMVSDGLLSSNVATTSISISAVNDAPVAVDDSASINEGGSVTINVQDNDSDAENDNLTTSIVTGPSNGTAIVIGTGIDAGKITYTHDGSESTSDSFTYMVSDGLLSSNVATTSISISAVNDAPVAVDDSASINEGGSVTINVQDNDSDAENDNLTTSIVTGPSNGTAIVIGTGIDAGKITYTHDGSESTSDSFTYMVSDGLLSSNVATTSISISAVNDAPVAVDDSASINEGGSVTINVQDNDSDAENDNLTTSIVTGPSNGTAIVIGTGIDAGKITYTHDGSESTSDSFTYMVSDGLLSSNVATTSISISAVNDAPVAVDDSASINEGGSVTINVQDNDSDAENDNLTTSIVTGPSNGTAIVIGTGIDAGKITYTHDGSESTSDSFTYMVSDGLLSSNVATTSISISAVNDAPVAVDDSASINEGGSVTINVQDNDSDAENDNLTTSIVTGPSNGTAIVIGTGIDAGKITYTHDGSESTSDSFTYMVSDGLLSSNVATTSISISAVNDAPVAVDDSASINEGGSVTINVQDNDSDAENDNLTTSIVTGPSNGTAIVIGTGIDAGKITYTHDGSESTSDSFTYMVSDGLLSSNVATTSISISAVNDAPVAVDDSASINEGGSVTINVQDNDSDAENDNLTTSIVTGPSNGTAIVIGTGIDAGKITYTHDGSESTSDSFTYKLYDGSLYSDAGEVSITIIGVNDAPVALSDSAFVDEGGTLVIDVQDNDSDVDTTMLTSIVVSQPSNGSAIVIATGADAGKITYTHDGSETTSDSFTYKLNDGNLDSNTATVSITITAVNDAPVAVDDSASINEGGSVTIDVQANDSDVDNTTLTTSIVTGPSNGTAIVIQTGADTGKIAYTHNGSETTSDSFTYRLYDGSLYSDTGEVSITIIGVNDAPVALSDSASVDEGDSVTIDVQDNDSDADNTTLTTSIVTGPSNGTAIVIQTGADTGKIAYTHNGSETTSDSFTYRLYDGSLYSDTGEVSITIIGVNDAPVAVDDSASINEGGSVTIDVQDNDSDADNTTLTTSIVTGPSNGTATVIQTGADTGKIAYTHNGSETTSDSFTYRLYDGSLYSDTGEVSITIIGVNDAPVALSDSASVDEGDSVTINVQDNDSDVDNTTLTTSIVTGPSNGTAIVIQTGADTGKIAYTHNGSETTSDSFTYRLYDGSLYSDTGEVSITIIGVNDAPVALSDSASVDEGDSVTIDVQANDSDVDNTTLTTSIVTGPSNGTATVIGTGIDAGKIAYTHNGSETTSDSFTYRLYDGSLDSNTATVSITITVRPADPVSPPATPEPSPTPAPTPTPVPIIVVPPEDVTPVPIAMPETQVLYLIDPSKENKIESADATVEFTLPKESTQRTYQVTIDNSAEACEGGTAALTDRVLTCTTVEIYSADAVRETNVRLIKPASATIRLTPEQVEELGGLPVLYQVYVAGGLTVMKRDDASSPWSSLRFELDTAADGGVEIRIPSIRDFSSFALAVDQTVLAQARALAGAAASPTPAAPSPTATAIATVTVEPTPTPMAVDLAPTPLPDVQVGDATAPPGLLLVLLLAGLILAVTGGRAVRDRASNSRR